MKNRSSRLGRVDIDRAGHTQDLWERLMISAIRFMQLQAKR